MHTTTRSAASRRRHPLSLLLMLGAALALAGCGDDSGGTTPTPAPAPAPAPTTPDPVGVPGGLKITATGPDFLEFGWEAVEGATGYEIQLSLTEGDFTAVDTATVTTTMHRFPVAAETTGYARVRANEGDRQSEWSETAMGTSMAAPLMLAVPAPMMSDSGPDFIEWSWEAVADAAAYEVQVAATEDGLDAATSERIETTTHRVAAEPETEMFLRVRAVAGTAESPVASAWSAAAAGMSEVAPNPLLVSLTPPGARMDPDCSGQAFCPDSETDPKKAMASVNPRMEVSSSHPVRMTPLFVEGASGLSLAAGADQTPFGRVTWMALQSTVAREGVTFRFDRVVLGAAQGAAAANDDTVYITCGPFRCSEAAATSPTAPLLSVADSVVCDAFQTEFTLVKGVAQNQGADTQRNAVDVGWEYTLSHPASVVHEFTNITPGVGTMSVPGAPLQVTSKPVALSMKPAAETSSSRVNKFGPEQNRDSTENSGADPGPIWNGYMPNTGEPTDCVPDTGLGLTYATINQNMGEERGLLSRVERPVNCFALLTDAHYEIPEANEAADIVWRDFVSGYRLHITPSTAVSWAGSRVAWGASDPFAALRCEPVTFEVAEQLDACEDFQEEAKAYWGSGIGRGGQFELQYRRNGNDNHARVTHLEIRNKANAPDETNMEEVNEGGEYRPDGSRHTHMWLVNAEAGVEGTDMGIDGTRKDHDLYYLTGLAHGREEYGLAFRTWRALMRVKTEDGDGDPAYGDFGKIDMEDADGDPGSDGVPENWDPTEDPDLACSDGDGPGCDAEAEFDLSATFTRLQDTSTCTYTVELSLTCTWDADGDRHRGGATRFHDDTIDNFISCREN